MKPIKHDEGGGMAMAQRTMSMHDGCVETRFSWLGIEKERCVRAVHGSARLCAAMMGGALSFTRASGRRITAVKARLFAVLLRKGLLRALRLCGSVCLGFAAQYSFGELAGVLAAAVLYAALWLSTGFGTNRLKRMTMALRFSGGSTSAAVKQASATFDEMVFVRCQPVVEQD